MSILVEIAEKADVSVEGVIRVLTREPVSDAIKTRVLAVLDDLTPEQTRAVQRFALAALHDVLLRPEDAELLAEPPPDENQLALPTWPEPAPDLLPSTGSDPALVQLSSVLGELAEAVRDLRRETDAERRERVDDLAVLIDLITTGWQGLDTRLGRIERQVTRLESGRREPIVAAPPRIVPPAIEAAPVVPEPVEAAPEPTIEPAASSTRDRLPVVAALTLVGAAIVTLAVLQLASGGPDVTRLVSSRDTPPATTEGLSATTGGAPTTTAPTTTSEVLGTTSSGTTAAKPKPATPKTTSSPPATTTRPAAAPVAPTGFKPTRNWAWAPVGGADYYDVVFTRQGTTFYRGSPTEPRLTLPGTVVFRPGTYRWVVRPGFGQRGARNLGAPIVDSPFTVGG